VVTHARNIEPPFGVVLMLASEVGPNIGAAIAGTANSVCAAGVSDVNILSLPNGVITNPDKSNKVSERMTRAGIVGRLNFQLKRASSDVDDALH